MQIEESRSDKICPTEILLYFCNGVVRLGGAARNLKTFMTMSEKESNNTPGTQPECMQPTNVARNQKIGILANYPDSEETRILLTPEACGMIVSSGHHVAIEAGLGIDINFSDEDYSQYGVEVVSRDEALAMPLVFSFRPLTAADIRKMQPGAALICMLDNTLFDRKVIEALLERRITLGCLNNMASHNEEPVFADVIDEIDGRAAIMYAEDHLSFLGGGKGVLIAGVAGINPCEILLIGTGTKINYAAISALAVGASVTIMDNDVSALQLARQFCGQSVTTCSIHPKVLLNRVKTADVIIMDHCTRDFEMPRNLLGAMKPNVYLLDLAENEPSQSVPRTVAMAMSNILVNFIDEMAMKNGIDGMITTTPGVQDGIVTYRGKLVDKLISSYLEMHGVDLSLLIAGGN